MEQGTAIAPAKGAVFRWFLSEDLSMLATSFLTPMSKSSPKKKSLQVALRGAKFVRWNGIVPRSVVPMDKHSRAAIVVNDANVPQAFVFDTSAFLDLLLTIDSNLLDHLSHEEYASKTANPTGYLIDKIEGLLPVRPSSTRSLKLFIDEAKKQGWVSFID